MRNAECQRGGRCASELPLQFRIPQSAFRTRRMTHTTFQVGRFRCHALEGGSQRLDGGAMFGVVPKPLWQRRIPADERNRIPLALRCLLVEHDDGLVLVDTGLGNKEDEKFKDIYGVVNERSEEHTSELQSQSNLVCRLLLEKKKNEVFANHVLLQGSCLAFDLVAWLSTDELTVHRHACCHSNPCPDSVLRGDLVPSTPHAV